MRRLAAALLAALALGPLATRGADAPLEIATLPGDASAEVFFARDQGFFRDVGLDVHITVLPNVQAQASAIAAGTLAIGNGNVGSIAVAHERGIDLKFIAPASVYNPAALTARLMVAKGSPIRSAADLNGKVVGTNGLQDQAHLESALWIEKHGGDIKSVRFVEVPFPEMAAALARGRIDAALMIEPLLTAAGDDVQPLGDAMGAIAPRFMSTGYFAADAWLRAHGDDARKFNEAIMRAALWANAHHAESAQILIRSARLDPAIAAKMTRATFGTRLDPRLMQPVIDMFVHFGTLPRPLDANELIWHATR